MSIGGPTAAHGLSTADRVPFAAGFVSSRDIEAIDAMAYPSFLPAAGLSFQASHKSLYSLNELTENRMAITWRWRQFWLGGVVTTFGKSDYYGEFGSGFATGFTSGPVAIGGYIGYRRLSFGEGYSAFSSMSGGAGATVSIGMLDLFGVMRCDGWEKSPDVYYPESIEGEAGFSFLTAGGIVSQGRVLLTSESDPTMAIAQQFELADELTLNWILVMKPVRFGGGCRLAVAGFVFGFDTSHHPILGWIHTVSLGYTFGR